ncbi:MAG: HD domain-containing protein [Deltaproteobacteria bacterium]|nr:HD domain-containing protein [Deltaproteobacteria bacterium]
MPLTKYLSRKSSLTILFLHGEVVVENTRIEDLAESHLKLIKRMEEMKLQRIQFRRGTTGKEVHFFLKLLPPLLKNPANADVILAKNQHRFPHILSGALPFGDTSQISEEEAPMGIQSMRQAMLSLVGNLKDIFAALDGPLSYNRLSLAKDTTERLKGNIEQGEITLKTIIYRRSSDPDPYIHAINVSALCMALSQELGLEESTTLDMGLGGLLHDIGLHLTPTVSMSNTQALNLAEKKRRWEHPIRGAEILLATPGMPDIPPLMAYEHHLHYDGGGYPRHVNKRDLNLSGMLVCIADTYDNLRRNRPTQKALPMKKVLDWMDLQIGKRFHPILLKKFRAMVKDLSKDELLHGA